MGWKTKTPYKNQSDQSFFFRPDFFDLDEGLEVSLKADGQSSLTLHLPQLGLTGVQIVCPNPTCLNTNQNQKKNKNKTKGFYNYMSAPALGCHSKVINSVTLSHTQARSASTCLIEVEHTFFKYINYFCSLGLRDKDTTMQIMQYLYFHILGDHNPI